MPPLSPARRAGVVCCAVIGSAALLLTRVSADATTAGVSYQVAFATYLGGSDYEQIRDIKTDAQGNIYVVGGTSSPNFPKTMGQSYAGSVDVFITKLSPAGQIVWSQCLGGPNYDRAYGVALDGQGNIYITGRSGRGFPVKNAFQPDFKGYFTGSEYGEENAFLAKLSNNGAVLWATYVGTSDMARDLTLDAGGNVYLAQNYAPASGQAPFPGAWFAGGFLKTPQGGTDLVVTKVDTNGTGVQWATYLGGSGNESPKASVRVDGLGNLVVLTDTTSTDAAVPGGYQTVNRGGGDVYLAKIKPDGSGLAWATYFGGSALEICETHHLAVDSQNNIYLAVTTQSPDAPTTPGAFRRTFAGVGNPYYHALGDALAAKFSPGGQFLAGTYVGGSNGDGPQGLATDAEGNLYFSGGTASADFPVTSGAAAPALRGPENIIAVRVAHDFTKLDYATFAGTSGPDEGRVAWADQDGTFYVGCETSSAGFQPLKNALQSSYGGGSHDACVIKLSPSFGQAPSVSAVVNAADSSTRLSPGVAAAVYGSNFGPGTVSGVTVTVAGRAAYVAQATSTQLAVQLPFDVPAGSATLTVTVNGASSTPFPIMLDAYAPALFAAGGAASGPGLILTAGNAGVTTSAPARPGDSLQAFAVGLGPANPPAPAGPAAKATPAAVTPLVTVGGIPAAVQFAGLAAGSAGLYQINFTVPAGLQGTQPVVVSIGGRSSSPVSLALYGISAVVNNASFASAGTAAAGSIVSVFANGIGTVDQMTGFPATAFRGVSVSFNGTPAPLFHLAAAQGQIDLLVPFELPASGAVSVKLMTPSGASPNYNLAMAPAAPGIYFLADPSVQGRVEAIAQFNATAWLAMPASMAAALRIPTGCTASHANPLAVCGQPAAPDDYLVLYTTGLGKATPNGDPNGAPLRTGEIPPANGSVLYRTVATPAVTVGGVPAKVLFSGIAPGFPGEYQIDFQVPPGVDGDDVPVTVSIAGASDTRTIPIHSR